MKNAAADLVVAGCTVIVHDDHEELRFQDGAATPTRRKGALFDHRPSEPSVHAAR
jgi:hypothetical protein